MIDLEEKNKVLGYAKQDSDGRLYISEDEPKANCTEKDIKLE